MAAVETASGSAPARRAWMRVLALADADELERVLSALGPLPPRRWLRKPETGMAMVRARTGGTGAQFNLGEITITRCAIAVGDGDGVMGVAYVRGRAARHAEQAAVADALLQLPQWRQRVQAEVIEPLARTHAERRAARAREAAQTKVDFYTLVRGED